MSHQSDYSFMQRAVANGWFYIWFVVYVFRYDRFTALYYKRVMRFELRSIVTLLILIAIPLHLSYDIGLILIKYSEGFYPIDGKIISKPSLLWSPFHRNLASVLDYTLACSMALLASIFFLLQSFYHYISKSVTKSSFMSSLEFRINIVCSLIVLAVFPLVQYLYRNNHIKREAAPQMAFSVVLISIGLLGIRTHFRFKSLLKVALMTVSEGSQSVIEKLEYFKDMNIVLVVAFLMTGTSLGIASIDGLTSSTVIARNKFASDLLVMNMNFFEFIIWVTLVLIFYPRRSIAGSAFGVSSGGGSLSRTAPISARHNANNSSNYQNQGDFIKSVNGNSNSTGKGTNRSYNTSKDRPPSVVPYKVPNDINNYDNNDTYPLTHIQEHDATDIVQMEAFKSMYDMESAPSLTIPPSKGRYDSNNSISFTPSQPTSPRSPNGSSFQQQQLPSQITTRVGQQMFVLEVAPGLDDYNQTRSPTSPSRPSRAYRPQYDS
ncbi:hypothetical protein BGX27_001483 [Mortierella sp. AM989]|nr:hypothetical protein BGX27_001483 [Mortierella sp. AM989]